MPRTHLIMVTRSGGCEAPEAEPVLVETDGDIVRLQLDDGATIDFDRRELLAAAADDAEAA